MNRCIWTYVVEVEFICCCCSTYRHRCSTENTLLETWLWPHFASLFFSRQKCSKRCRIIVYYKINFHLKSVCNCFHADCTNCYDRLKREEGRWGGIFNFVSSHLFTSCQKDQIDYFWVQFSVSALYCFTFAKMNCPKSHTSTQLTNFSCGRGISHCTVYGIEAKLFWQMTETAREREREWDEKSMSVA